MTTIHTDLTDREITQVKIFETALDALKSLESEINGWLRENREVRLERVQVNTIETKRAVVMLWYSMTIRSTRGVGFGSEAAATSRA
jgi:hypothetical protein